MNDVYILGMGCISPYGTLSEFKEKLYTNFCGIKKINNPLFKNIKCSGIIPQKYYSSSLEIPNFINWIDHATLDAIIDSKIDLSKYPSTRIGIFIGSTVGLLSYEEDFWKTPQKYDNIKYMSMRTINPFLTSNIVTKFKIQGPIHTISNACTSGIDAIIIGSQFIKAGIIDVAIVGGIDSPLSYTLDLGFKDTKFFTKNFDGTYSSIYSNKTFGVIPGEACGILILSSKPISKNLPPIKIKNSQTFNDGIDFFSIDTNTKVPSHAISKTCTTPPSFINSGAVGLKHVDLIEYKAIKSTFMDTYNEIPICTIKTQTGHCFAAMGILQVISSIIALRKQKLFSSNINHEIAYDLNITKSNIAMELKDSLILTRGIGGNTSTLLIGF